MYKYIYILNVILLELINKWALLNYMRILHDTPVEFRQLKNRSCRNFFYLYLFFLIVLLNSEMRTAVFKKNEKREIVFMN